MGMRRAALVILAVIGLVFVLATVSPAQYVCTGSVFDDVSSTNVGDAFCGFIEHFASLGITGGCNVTPPLYCPDNYVTRSQMAVFISSAIAPRTQYFTVGGEAFVPGSTSDGSYVNSYGCGGAYFLSGGGKALLAPVHLPQGAVVTEFKVFFDDTSANDMSVSLFRHNLSSCGYSGMATVTSSGTAGYYSLSYTSILNNVIDNTQFSYDINAFSDAWGPNLKIKGAVITYTTP